MISILEQERREAVKDYQSQMAMFKYDDIEEAYNKGWDDHKKMTPGKMTLLTYFIGGFVAGVIVMLIF